MEHATRAIPRRITAVSWTEAEDKILRREFARGTPTAAIARLFPARTHCAVSRRLVILRLCRYRRWPQAEDDVIRRGVAAKESPEVIVTRLPGRTLVAVVNRIKTLDLDRPTRQFWTDAEDDVLRREAAGELRPAEVSALLPGRTRSGISQRRRKLGFLERTVTPWIDAEDEIIARGVTVDQSPGQIAALLPGRTAASVRHRMVALNLHTPPTAAQTARVIEMWESHTPRQIAAEVFGTPAAYHRVTGIASRAGLGDWTGWTPEVERRIRELHEQGLDYHEIAAAMPGAFEQKFPHQVVARIARALGLKPNYNQAVWNTTRRAAKFAALNSATVARYGLPPTLTVRHLAVLLALTTGPRTLAELSQLCGFSVLRALKHSTTSCTGELLALGYIAYLRRTRPAEVGRVQVPGTYMLTAKAMEALSQAANNERSRP